MSKWFKDNLEKIIMIWWTIAIPLSCLIGVYQESDLSNQMVLFYVSIGIGMLFSQNSSKGIKDLKSK